MDNIYTFISSLQEKIHCLENENKKLKTKLEESKYNFEKKMQIESENETLQERINFLIYDNSEKTKEIETCKTALNLFKQLLKYI